MEMPQDKSMQVQESIYSAATTASLSSMDHWIVSMKPTLSTSSANTHPAHRPCRWGLAAETYQNPVHRRRELPDISAAELNEPTTNSSTRDLHLLPHYFLFEYLKMRKASVNGPSDWILHLEDDWSSNLLSSGRNGDPVCLRNQPLSFLLVAMKNLDLCLRELSCLQFRAWRLRSLPEVPFLSSVFCGVV